MSSPKVSIGIIAYHGEKYFATLFASLAAQDYKNIEILVLDNASPSNDGEILEKNWGQFLTLFKSEKNLGFAAGHNFLIRQMSGDYYLCLNQDVFLEPNFLSILVAELEEKKNIGGATGKLYAWNVELGTQGKTNILDTTGIEISHAHHSIDRGQGEDDRGQYDAQKNVFGVSAAAALYRRNALEDIAGENEGGEKEYFDELFFMYKEDVDLSYRLQWAGWQCVFVPEAVGFHDRTTKKKMRNLFTFWNDQKQKSSAVRALSWRNEQLLLWKNFSPEFSWKTHLFTFLFRLGKTVFFFLHSPIEGMKTWRDFVRKKKLSIAKKNLLSRRRTPEEMEKLLG